MLENKVTVVTGAASGIGYAFCERAAAEGAIVMVLDVNAEAAQQAAERLRDKGGHAEAFVVDVSSSESVKAAVDDIVSRHGRIDACFNNAGITAPVIPLPDYPEDVFDRVLRVNTYGCFHVLKHVMAVMREQGSGAIVNTGSTSGLRGIANFAPYIASKHAVLGLTKTAALEGLEYGVRVNAICPGMTETPINDDFHKFANPDDPDRTREQFTALIPIKRYAEPSEMAAVAAFLLSDDASYIAGEIVNVDGALTTGI